MVVLPFTPAITQRYQLKRKLHDQRRRVATLSEAPKGFAANWCASYGSCYSSPWEMQLPTGNSSVSTLASFSLTGNKAMREDCREIWFLYILYTHSDQVFFLHWRRFSRDWVTEVQMAARQDCCDTGWMRYSSVGMQLSYICRVIELPAKILLSQCGVCNQESILYIFAWQKRCSLVFLIRHAADTCFLWKISRYLLHHLCLHPF